MMSPMRDKVIATVSGESYQCRRHFSITLPTSTKTTLVTTTLDLDEKTLLRRATHLSHTLPFNGFDECWSPVNQLRICGERSSPLLLNRGEGEKNLLWHENGKKEGKVGKKKLKDLLNNFF